jgi:hypothetical protein
VTVLRVAAGELEAGRDGRVGCEVDGRAGVGLVAAGDGLAAVIGVDEGGRAAGGRSTVP